MKSHIANIDKQNPTTHRDGTDGRRPFQTFIPGGVRAPGGSGRYPRPQVRRPFCSGLGMWLALLAIGLMSSVRAQEYTFTTLAGPTGGPGAIDGTRAAARFNHPVGVAGDATGNVYVADQFNHTVRKIAPGGVVTTLAGLAGSPGSANGTGSGARFNGLSRVAVDGIGNVYLADEYNHTIRKVAPAGW